jgi:hypothetical protein
VKHLLVRILLFLLLGAIINVAVAWGCEYFDHGPKRDSVDLTDTQAESSWKSFAPSAWMNAPLDGRRLVYDTTVTDELVLYADNDCRVMHIMHAGWPCKSLRGAVLRFYGSGTLVKVELIHLVEWVELEWLPLRPIWPGVAINTVFYAAVLWLLFAAPFALRKWRRIRRGLCPKCGYDLRNRPIDSAVCPECGATR